MEDTLRLLLQGGADPNTTIYDGDLAAPPLAFAFVCEGWRQPGVMRLLLDAGADPNPSFLWEGQLTSLLDLAIHDEDAVEVLPDLIRRQNLGSLQAPALQMMYERLLEG